MKIVMALPRTSRSESGFALVEALISAAVLAIVALAVLSGIDGANFSSAREKARAVASNLAEQDQEQLRSMTVDQLTSLQPHAPVTIDGATYQVTSKAEWVTDDTGGTAACGSTSNKSQYLHVTSTVTSNIVGSRLPAVKIDSLVSPSVAYSQTHGALGVKIIDRNGQPVPNLSVSAALVGGTALTSLTTDPTGCAVWYSVAVGNYSITATKSGWGTPDGKVSPVAATQTVSPNTVSFVNLTMDQLTSATINIKSHIPGKTPTTGNTYDSKARSISDASASTRTWTPSATSLSTPITADTLYPFASTSYSFYTGACSYQSPRQYTANYFSGARQRPRGNVARRPDEDRRRPRRSTSRR